MERKPSVARFWTWHREGYVRLTVREGEALSWSSVGPTEEGWSGLWQTWSYEDGVLRLREHTDGRDCDGRMSTSDAYACRWGIEGALWENCDRVLVPKWERVSCRQRDYSAEAMGY